MAFRSYHVALDLAGLGPVTMRPAKRRVFSARPSGSDLDTLFDLF